MISEGAVHLTLIRLIQWRATAGAHDSDKSVLFKENFPSAGF